MKKVILYTWNDSGEPFGIFSSKEAADNAVKEAADFIKVSVEKLKLDLYIYEMQIDTPAQPITKTN